MDAVPNWDQVADEIERVLPTPLSAQQRKLLPQILQEWGRTDWQEHLSRESRAVVKNRIKKLEVVKERARELKNALDAIDGFGRSLLFNQLMKAEGRSLLDLSQAERVDRSKRFDEQCEFLSRLAAITPADLWNPISRRPRSIRPYLILQDAAVIFEWLTGTRATREVSRTNGEEIGPFFQFVSILWPVIFGKGTEGLPSAIKNWAQWQKAYDEQSPLIENIAGRHPTWGIFDP